MLTLSKSIAYLAERGIKVSRQALHLYVQKHAEHCQKITSVRGERAALWLVPESLLDDYSPSLQHQEAGKIRLNNRKDSVISTQKK